MTPQASNLKSSNLGPKHFKITGRTRSTGMGQLTWWPRIALDPLRSSRARSACIKIAAVNLQVESRDASMSPAL
eukprot:2336925-Rhodomonas_salina.2